MPFTQYGVGCETELRGIMLREGACVVVRPNVPALRPMEDGHGRASSGPVHDPTVRMFSTPRVILLIGARSENLIEVHICETRKADCGLTPKVELRADQTRASVASIHRPLASSNDR